MCVTRSYLDWRAFLACIQLTSSFPSVVKQLNSSVRPVPPPRDHLRIEQDGRLVNRAPAPQVPERNHPQHASLSHHHHNVAGDHPLATSPIGQVMAPTSEQLDKYKVRRA